ncbi:hypothetical protein KJ766_02790, partial [Patescibacteria group bacterium]|nr:hypothetical protein [Patescibacteria group bacterium]
YYFGLLLTILFVGAGCISQESENQYTLHESSNQEINDDSALIDNESQLDIDSSDAQDLQEQETIPSETPSVATTWQTYTNTTFGYSLTYPSSWFYAPDACCPPPPSYVVLNNVSDVFFEFTARQIDPGTCSFSILCDDQGDLNTHGELQSRISNGEKYSQVSLNGYPAYQFENSLYVADGVHSCRISNMGSCSEIYTILNSFSF